MVPWTGPESGPGGGGTVNSSIEVHTGDVPPGTGEGKKGLEKGVKKGSMVPASRTDVVRIADAAKCEVYVCFEGPLGAHLKQEVRDKIHKYVCGDFFPIAFREV